jgi:hypothetical protein
MPLSPASDDRQVTTLADAREITDFLAANVCLTCANAIRHERADLDEMVVALLSTRPRACPEPADPHQPRDSRIAEALIHAVLLAVAFAAGCLYSDWTR